MELSPAVAIIVAVVVVAMFVFIRWGNRHEAAAPAEARDTPVRSNTISAAEERESQPLVKWLLERASEETGIPVADDPVARERIAKAAVEAMEDLRAGRSATVNLPYLTGDSHGPHHFAIEFTRNSDSTFEQHGG